ncbi:MAG: hypothetical protein WBV85_00920 [Solirubrobacteraceae bacterium]
MNAVRYGVTCAGARDLPRVRARVLCLGVMLSLLVTGAPASATSTKATTDPALRISIPASARVHGTTGSTTPAPATTAPVSTVPAATTPPSTTPAGGAQPGTIAPSSTSTTGTTPTPTTNPAVPSTATTPTTGAPGTTVHSSTVVVVHQPSKPTHLSTGALLLAILGALLLLACIAWGIGRWLALEPRWAAALTYSLREASYRGSATWAEFSDWARLGR